MLENNFSLTITEVIAVCAIISPILTALLNNYHQYRMKKLEYRQKEQEEQRRYEREVYEGYARAAAACIQAKTPEALKDFGAHTGLASFYVPDEVRKKMQQLELSMTLPLENETQTALLADIITDLRKLQPHKANT